MAGREYYLKSPIYYYRDYELSKTSIDDPLLN
jgi:hypothetical protein